MNDRMTTNNNSELSAEFMNYLKSLITEIIVNGDNYNKYKKWLEKYIDNENINRRLFLTNLEDLLELVDIYRNRPNTLLLDIIEKKMYLCHLERDYIHFIIKKIYLPEVVDKDPQNFGYEISRGIGYHDCYKNYYDKQEFKPIELSSAKILVTNSQIADINIVTAWVNSICKPNQNFIIIAENFSDEVLNYLLNSFLHHNQMVFPVLAPGFGERRDEMCQDIAILTGAKVFQQSDLLNIRDNYRNLGKSVKTILNFDVTTIFGYKYFSQLIFSRISEISKEVELSTSDYDKEKITERFYLLSKALYGNTIRNI